MYKHWYHKDWGKTTKQRVRQIVTIGLPETILPEHVAEFGFIPFIDNPQPAHINIEKVIDAGIVITETEATQTWEKVDRFETQEETDIFIVQELINTKLQFQTRNKQSCTSFILEKYPEPTQRSAALGVYPAEFVETMADHIARIIAEENRVCDLLSAATTIEELTAVETPTWPEV